MNGYQLQVVNGEIEIVGNPTFSVENYYYGDIILKNLQDRDYMIQSHLNSPATVQLAIKYHNTLTVKRFSEFNLAINGYYIFNPLPYGYIPSEDIDMILVLGDDLEGILQIMEV